MTDCLILAGGLGTRLRSAVPDLPKCLAPVNGRPFLYWQMKKLAGDGIRNFVLSLGYRSDDVILALEADYFSEFSVRSVVEPRPLGTGGAASFALEEAGLGEALIVNGDTYLDGDLSPLCKALPDCGKEIGIIGIVGVQDRSRYGSIALDPSGRITSLSEKLEDGEGFINAGAYRLLRRSLGSNWGRSISIECDILPSMIENSIVFGSILTGSLIDIGVPADYAKFLTYAEKNRLE